MLDTSTFKMLNNKNNEHLVKITILVLAAILCESL